MVKITRQNIVSEWGNIKKYMTPEVIDAVEFIAETPEDWTDPDFKDEAEKLIKKINEILANVDEDGDNDSDSDENFVEDEDEDEDEEDEVDILIEIDDAAYEELGIEDADFIDPTKKEFDKNLYKKYVDYLKKFVSKEFEKKSLDKSVYEGLENENYHRINQFLIDNGYYKGKYAKTTAEILEGKKEPKAKKEKKSKEKAGPKVDTSKALPHWHRILKKFISMAGSKKDTWRVREYLRDIQGSCNKKLGRKTPFVELIQEIHDKLLPLANSDSKSVEIPKYDGLVAQCRQAFKDAKVGMSAKVDVNPYESVTLSGVDGIDNLDYLYTCEGKKKMKR